MHMALYKSCIFALTLIDILITFLQTNICDVSFSGVTEEKFLGKYTARWIDGDLDTLIFQDSEAGQNIWKQSRKIYQLI